MMGYRAQITGFTLKIEMGQGRQTIAEKCIDGGKEVVRVLSSLFKPRGKVICWECRGWNVFVKH